jgi:hypothetical protein
MEENKKISDMTVEELLERLDIQEIKKNLEEMGRCLKFLTDSKIEEKRKPFEEIYKILLEKQIITWGEASKIYSRINRDSEARTDFLNFCNLRKIRSVILPSAGRPKYLILSLEDEPLINAIIDNWGKISGEGILLHNFSLEMREKIKNFLLNNFDGYFEYRNEGSPVITYKRKVKNKKQTF